MNEYIIKIKNYIFLKNKGKFSFLLNLYFEFGQILMKFKKNLK